MMRHMNDFSLFSLCLHHQSLSYLHPSSASLLPLPPLIPGDGRDSQSHLQPRKSLLPSFRLLTTILDDTSIYIISLYISFSMYTSLTTGTPLLLLFFLCSVRLISFLLIQFSSLSAELITTRLFHLISVFYFLIYFLFSCQGTNRKNEVRQSMCIRVSV